VNTGEGLTGVEIHVICLKAEILSHLMAKRRRGFIGCGHSAFSTADVSWNDVLLVNVGKEERWRL
jgi:hypothetical protein